MAIFLLSGTQTASAGIAGPPEVIASGLQFPWEVALVPDGRILVTERPGRIRVIDADGQLRAAPAYQSPGQFLGLALHPDYATNHFVYLYNTYQVTGGWRNRIQRFVDNGTTLTLDETVLDQIPGENNHDGGRIKFGPDGKLWVTTGDVHDPDTPQDLESLAGKILRLNVPGNDQDGTAPSDNPYPDGANSKYVWSYGHRHPQGIAWDAAGRLWATEHGPSGETYAHNGLCCRDELNLIEQGANYGWPVIMGDEQQAGMRSPVISSGDSVAWAPAGATFAPDGHLYFSNLLGAHLREVTMAGTQVVGQTEHFRGVYGRLRAAVYGRGALYITTSNNGDDEKVLRVPLTTEGGSAVAPVGNPAPASGAPGILPSRVDRTRPSLAGLRLVPRRFRAASKGTTVRYTLSEPATVRFTVQRSVPGRRSMGSFARRGLARLNSFRFSGRVRGRRLAPGRYRLTAVATDSARNKSVIRRTSFRIASSRPAS